MDDVVKHLAQAMGVEEFRPGRHILRDEKRWRTGEIFVNHAWYAHVLPAFDDNAVIGVVRTSESQFRGQTFPAFFRAGMAVFSPNTEMINACERVTITSDLVRESMASIDLFAHSESVYLDGIGYDMHYRNAGVDVRLRLGNPDIRQWMVVENALLSTAILIAKRSQNRDIRKFVNTWQGYAKDRENA